VLVRDRRGHPRDAATEACLKTTALCCALWLATAAVASAQSVPPAAQSGAASLPPEAGLELGPDLGSTLPDEPAKGLVLVECNICHGLEWIERSGASLEGWQSRIRRMIRAGAQIPPEHVPILVEYLARVLPERPKPPPAPPKHAASSSARTNHR
jgi:hypothetical protein